MHESKIIRSTWKVIALLSATAHSIEVSEAVAPVQDPSRVASYAAKTSTITADSLAAYASPEWVACIAKGQVPYHRLSMNDFKTATVPVSKFVSYTQTFAFYSYHFKIQRGDFVVARLDSSSVRSGIDRQNSWKRSNYKTFPQMLQHEQGHLDINELFARKLALRLSQVDYVGQGKTDAEAIDNLKQQVQAVYNGSAEERDAADLQYDAETDHGLDKAKQDLWTTYLEAQLKAAGISSIWIEPGAGSVDQEPRPANSNIF